MDSIFDVALLILRIVFGLTLAIHGLGKLRNISFTATWFDSEGLRPAKFHAWLAGGTEFAAGLGIALGLLTPLASLAYIGVMTTAGWIGHRKNGYSSAKGGWEHVFVLAIAAAVIALLGPGEISLDNWINNEITDVGWINETGWRWGAFIFATAGGVFMSLVTLFTFYRPSTAGQGGGDATAGDGDMAGGDAMASEGDAS